MKSGIWAEPVSVLRFADSSFYNSQSRSSGPLPHLAMFGHVPRRGRLPDWPDCSLRAGYRPYLSSMGCGQVFSRRANLPPPLLMRDSAFLPSIPLKRAEFNPESTRRCASLTCKFSRTADQPCRTIAFVIGPREVRTIDCLLHAASRSLWCSLLTVIPPCHAIFCCERRYDIIELDAHNLHFDPALRPRHT